MKRINSVLDEIIRDKVYRKCEIKNITKYMDIAKIINTSDSFVYGIYSGRKKFNLYHLIQLSYALDCKVDDFLPNFSDFKIRKIEGNTVEECYKILMEDE